MLNKLGLTMAALILLSPTTASAMSLSFSWGPTKQCFDRKSPPMKVSRAPKGTVKLKFHMTDLDARSYYHGGGTVKYKGRGSFGYGSFSYKGPCPPSRHTYQFTVKALDKSGKTLATASAKRSFK